MIRAVIIEDEQNSRELLRSAICTFTEGMQIIGEAADVVSGIATINDLNPDVIFLDIELPDGKGFDVLDKISISNYKVIFVTAYDDYAIKAIRYAAFDYLLKPLNFQNLKNAISRLATKPDITQVNFEVLQESLNGESKSNKKLMIPNHNGYTMIELEKIIAVVAEGSYVFFNLDDGSRHLAAHSLSYYEELLPDQKFYRIHKSHIVNFTKVKSVEPGRTGCVYLENGFTMEIAARRKSAFLAFLKNHSGS